MQKGQNVLLLLVLLVLLVLVLLFLRHTFYFHAISQELLQIRPANVAFGGHVTETKDRD